MGHSDEGQQMVFADRTERDVAGEDQFVVPLVVRERREVEGRWAERLGVARTKAGRRGHPFPVHVDPQRLPGGRSRPVRPLLGRRPGSSVRRTEPGPSRPRWRARHPVSCSCAWNRRPCARVTPDVPARLWHMTTMPSTDVLTATRQSLHRAAEHLLAAARKRATGEITLLPAPDGVTTPPLPDGRVVSLEGGDVVVRRPSGERRAPLTTLVDAAGAVGLQPGFPGPSTGRAPTTSRTPRWHVDPTAAAALARWFVLGDEALRALAAEVPAEQPAHRRSSRSTSTSGSPQAGSTTASRPATTRSPRRTSTSGRTTSLTTRSGTRRSVPTGPGGRSPRRSRRWPSSAPPAWSSGCNALRPAVTVPPTAR